MSLANPDLAPRQGPGHWRDVSVLGLTWRGGGLEIRKTGVRLKLDRDLVAEVASWAVWLPILAIAHLAARLRNPVAARIWYTPDRAGPWYLLRGAALWAGFRVARSPDQADAGFYFDDTTRGTARATPGIRLFNGACTDISKRRVAEVFAEVFGYPLGVDPRCAIGPIVEKADKNGVHDGRIVEGPLTPRDGRAYQRLVETTDASGLVHDLRTPCVGGRPAVVWEKTRRAERRFGIQNSRAVLRDPAAVFSRPELDLIARFNARMGLDWGGLDILRAASDGRIYIVDVNKTDLGPVIALSWSDKICSMSRLAGALRDLIARERPTGFGA